MRPDNTVYRDPEAGEKDESGYPHNTCRMCRFGTSNADHGPQKVNDLRAPDLPPKQKVACSSQAGCTILALGIVAVKLSLPPSCRNFCTNCFRHLRNRHFFGERSDRRAHASSKRRSSDPAIFGLYSAKVAGTRNSGSVTRGMDRL
jgi:hypothetical protein